MPSLSSGYPFLGALSNRCRHLLRGKPEQLEKGQETGEMERDSAAFLGQFGLEQQFQKRCAQSSSAGISRSPSPRPGSSRLPSPSLRWRVWRLSRLEGGIEQPEPPRVTHSESSKLVQGVPAYQKGGSGSPHDYNKRKRGLPLLLHSGRTAEALASQKPAGPLVLRLCTFTLGHFSHRALPQRPFQAGRAIQ